MQSKGGEGRGGEGRGGEGRGGEGRGGEDSFKLGTYKKCLATTLESTATEHVYVPGLYIHFARTYHVMQLHGYCGDFYHKYNCSHHSLD